MHGVRPFLPVSLLTNLLDLCWISMDLQFDERLAPAERGPSITRLLDLTIEPGYRSTFPVQARSERC